MQSGKDRQKALRERRRAEGIKQHVFWLRPEWVEEVKRLIAKLALAETIAAARKRKVKRP